MVVLDSKNNILITRQYRHGGGRAQVIYTGKHTL